FNTGISAARAGMNIKDVTAISLALNKLNDVPQEDTVKWLGDIRQFQNLAKTGFFDQAKATGLALASGFTINPMADSATTVLEKIAVYLQSLKSDNEAITKGGLAGLSDKQSLALRHAGANLPQIIAETSRALTNADVKKAKAVVDATNDMNQAWGRLKTTFTGKFSDSVVAL